MVVRSPSQYNGIIGRPGIRKIHAIPSTVHGMLKFLVEGGTVTLRSSMIILMECAMISGPSTRPPEVGKILEEKIKVAIHPEYPEQTIAIGSTLTEKGHKELCTLLGQNLNVFAWKPADMTGVPRHTAEHHLNFQEGCLPIRQKKRGQAPERNKAIQEEVEKLVDAGIMKEVHYHSWLSNKACPQDGYPLLEIDWKVESLCGYPFKCFLDAYKGYHQIKMAKKDEENPHGRRNYPRYRRNIQNPPANKHEAKSKKCTFGMQEGMFLGYKVNADGLKVCPDKANAVLSFPSLRCLKDVQKLNG
ncbi:hypothetical protein Tco_1051388, partial [Tanacetum coccineum]